MLKNMKKCHWEEMITYKKKPVKIFKAKTKCLKKKKKKHKYKERILMSAGGNDNI